MKSLSLFLALSAPAFAATSFVLPGASESGTWNLNRTNYNNGTSPAYPASGTISAVTQSNSLAWGGPIAATSTSATFTRLSGPGYFISSGSGIYGTGVVNTYAVEDLAPMPDMVNLIFQARTNNPGLVGMTVGGGFASVLLYLNGDITTPIAATYSQAAAVLATAEDDSDFAWQWDLSGAGTITSYRIVIEANPHNAFYGNAADLTMVSASNSFVQAVPEPSSVLLGCAALGFTVIRRRRA
ncbi:MAG: PEP-CTERM sorting domain-containing protein [Verrucomicrobiota bacterium]